jgi:hypothetical protein
MLSSVIVDFRDCIHRRPVLVVREEHNMAVITQTLVGPKLSNMKLPSGNRSDNLLDFVRMVKTQPIVTPTHYGSLKPLALCPVNNSASAPFLTRKISSCRTPNLPSR